jgi:OmpA-OmpF porin, OOP family
MLICKANKTKKGIVIIFLSFYFLTLKCQNLVPNPSFEEFIDFNNSISSNWHKVQDSDTPDYFDLGNMHSFNNIFEKYQGGIQPKTGNCFVGIFCLRINPERKIKNIREFIESPLSGTLEKDSLYKVTLALSLDAESNIAVKNFSIYFSNATLKISEKTNFYSIKPQVVFNSTFLDSVNGWMEVQSFYKSNGTENNITLGNFMQDRSTIIKEIHSRDNKGKKDKWNLVNKEKASYYYLDDVSVVKVHTLKDFVKANTEVLPSNDSVFNINSIRTDSLIILKNIVFEFNKSELLPQSYAEINKLYQLMTSNPSIRIKLEGHTDNIGGYDFNMKLSLKRVEAVVTYLIQQGIDPSRIEFAGYSYLQPIGSNENEEDRKSNRRVAFKIIQK